MAAAYAALVSLMSILDDIQQHPSPPISIRAQHLHSLTQILTSLQEYLGDFQSEDDPLEMRITDAVYKAEDVIESHLLDTINASFFNCFLNFFNCFGASKFYQDLEGVIEEMDFIKRMAAEMVAKNKVIAVGAHEDVSASAAPAVRSSLSSNSMVCSDAVLRGLMDKLTQDQRDRQIIPIVGMGGLGKTTLSRTIYERKVIQEHFNVCAWITVSQKYNTRELLSEVLVQVTKQKIEEVREMSEDKVGLMLYQFLFGKRFLIVMDDMWSIDAWNGIQCYFPDNKNGSRILVTTRLSELGSELNKNYSLKMEFLDEDHSWELFSKTVFGKESCPPELMKFGKKIVENCRGLPLSIIVVGGILRKRELTYGSWESISNNLASIVNLENDEHCLRLLKLSYNHLPLYLKPCFLYMGVFEEDKIKVPTIIKLWVSEGFIKPVDDRTLETIAMGFLKNLVDRNLIMIHEFGSTGKIKTCKMHDLFRDLCLKEGQKYGFFHVIGQSTSINRQCRRIFIPMSTLKKKVLEGLQSMPYARSVICENEKVPQYQNSGLHVHILLFTPSLLESAYDYYSCPSYSESTVPVGIWKMRQFRHIEFIGSAPVNLPDPRSDMDEDVLMENLQVLKGVSFKCSKEVVKRISNLKKLKTKYYAPPKRCSEYDDWYCVINIQYLSKLESLHMDCFKLSGGDPFNLQNLSFPRTLKNLTLMMNFEFEWKEVMLEKIGSLPHLEKLRLWYGCMGSEIWEIKEGGFQKLKHLGLFDIQYWKQWTVEELPCLQQLRLSRIKELEGIPSEIGVIPTLQKIWLMGCSEAVVMSAKEMVKEQMDCQGDDQWFQVEVVLFEDNQELKNLAGPQVNDFHELKSMAAYAALVSLRNILDDIQQHPSPPISIDAKHLQSLTQILTSLHEYLRAFKSENDPLEMGIVGAAHKAEDVIESHLVDTINRRHTTHHAQNSSAVAKIRASMKQEDADNEQTKSLKFYQDLDRVIEEMDLIKQLAAEKVAKNMVVEVRAHEDVYASAAPIRYSLPSSSMVCSDVVLLGLLDMLLQDRQDCQIIPIVGMVGLGKTTLARTIYEHKLIPYHFDVCAWITVSQEYNTRELLNEVLVQVSKQKIEEVREMSEDKVGLKLYIFLSGRRFLIVMDDMWSIDAWNEIQRYFPDNKNDSRILVTTRLSQLGSELNKNYSLQMEFLDEDQSWELFSKSVFGEESCPHELMKIGMKIVKNCRGLPLSIVVVGGILREKELTYGSWESISNKLTSAVNLANGEHCLILLKLSYNHLPIYLKPCFLYMGVFEEDDEIKVSTIIKLWVSEGFLEPVNDGSLETIAMGFLKDLVDRNLIMIHEFGRTGKIKTCKIHVLFRDFCLNEGQKYGFFHVIGQTTSFNTQCRRIVIPRNTYSEEVLEGLQSMPHARSFLCEYGNVPPYLISGLVRTFHAYKYRFSEYQRYLNPSAVHRVNLRHLAVELDSMSTIFSSLHLFWNLHTIIVSCESNSKSTVPVGIWKMCQFRHIEFINAGVDLPDPLSSMDEDVVIMENLQVLKGVNNFKCSKEVVKRIPNLKKLKTIYFEPLPERSSSFYDDCYCVSNIQYLAKLESLSLGGGPYVHKLSFPPYLRNLTLMMNDEFEWKEEMLEKIGSLSHLEKLRLWFGCLGSGEWEIEEGQFPKLKYLDLYSIRYWIQWRVEGLPCLQQLHLSCIQELEGIPREIGEVATLQKIKLIWCNKAVFKSAKDMVEEQMDCQGDELPFHVEVELGLENPELMSLAGPNFTVKY